MFFPVPPPKEPKTPVAPPTGSTAWGCLGAAVGATTGLVAVLVWIAGDSGSAVAGGGDGADGLVPALFCFGGFAACVGGLVGYWVGRWLVFLARCLVGVDELPDTEEAADGDPSG